MADLTRLLLAWRRGDDSALEELTPKVYDELHRVAAAIFRKERRDHTLQPTALVHEAFLRLVDGNQVDWESRAHFVGFAARLMRQILIDQARRKQAQKRGGDAFRTTVDVDLVPRQDEVDVLELHAALQDLAEFNPEGAEAVELTYFGGLTHAEVAEVLGVSATTVKRLLTTAKAWLRRELAGGEDSGR